MIGSLVIGPSVGHSPVVEGVVVSGIDVVGGPKVVEGSVQPQSPFSPFWPFIMDSWPRSNKPFINPPDSGGGERFPFSPFSPFGPGGPGDPGCNSFATSSARRFSPSWPRATAKLFANSFVIA